MDITRTIPQPLPVDVGYALFYARRHWPVFPLFGVVDGRCECGRSTCTEPGRFGKHPRTLNGYKDATTDEEQIARWWQMWPNSNIGLATGSGLVVVDEDPRHGGEVTLENLIGGRPFPRTPTAYTGGGGLHFYFTGSVERSGAGALGPGLDVKAEGGYVVAPPSLHGSGERYAWLVLDEELAALPRYLHPIPRLPSLPPPTKDQTTAYLAGALESACQRVQAAEVGTRNDTLNREAHSLFRLIASGLSARRACEALEAAAISAGLSRAEARRTLVSALDARMNGAAS